ncbi:MAG: thymidylate kinase [Candidatus Thermoplasmatota archaeon]|nr:thymidylate kinase [Candidatus Thermoplasmatota archaeon]MEC7349507.1 thymidylate kinase [Candidatus Thermoplasmatota archaeon]MEC7416042.1 thymidylate kinase [Candidatus Thermoplasmatota archaeon]MEC7494247.1 thymidylate kinase [Candidatus Thermoplasmatota archaeon]MEC7697441.1 thymidylate kinase [Candidatus Thermoplasmatota archaeon]|tara:strand:+ start:9044 stop:9712 length:669 start_codon:yes stop_codon:yes gene_type:complete
MPPSGVDLKNLRGHLIAIEGLDSSGKTLHCKYLSKYLKEKGYPTKVVGLSESLLVSETLDKAKKSNILSPLTRSLFYATDFYDQMEKIIIPNLLSGRVIICDGYVFTLFAREFARKKDKDWVMNVFGKAIIPDLTLYLKVKTKTLADRVLLTKNSLDYWESGMDMGIDSDWYRSFRLYQKKLGREFNALSKEYDFKIVKGGRKPKEEIDDILSHVNRLLPDI